MRDEHDARLVSARRTGFHRTLRYTLSPAGVAAASNCTRMSKVGSLLVQSDQAASSHAAGCSLEHSHARTVPPMALQVLLVQALPREVFVDPYQLEDACRLHGAFSFELLGPVELEL